MSSSTHHPESVPAPARLKANSMSWIGAGLMGAVIMSPASGLYFNFAPTSMAAGNVVPLIFLIAMVVTLPTALSYASMSRSLPSSGSAYTWMRRACALCRKIVKSPIEPYSGPTSAKSEMS